MTIKYIGTADDKDARGFVSNLAREIDKKNVGDLFVLYRDADFENPRLFVSDQDDRAGVISFLFTCATMLAQLNINEGSESE